MPAEIERALPAANETQNAVPFDSIFDAQPVQLAAQNRDALGVIVPRRILAGNRDQPRRQIDHRFAISRDGCCHSLQHVFVPALPVREARE